MELFSAEEHAKLVSDPVTVIPIALELSAQLKRSAQEGKRSGALSISATTCRDRLEAAIKMLSTRKKDAKAWYTFGTPQLERADQRDPRERDTYSIAWTLHT